MKVDGYQAPSNEIALQEGVKFIYPTDYGDISIQSRLAGRQNASFRLAMQTYQQWAERRKNLTSGKIDNEAEQKLVELVYDHLVIAWSTTIKSDGKEIEPSRENFVALLTSPAVAKVFSVYLEDSTDEKHFRPLSTDELVGKSSQPSVGTSGGPSEKAGSER